jgi:hypothetical protein
MPHWDDALRSSQYIQEKIGKIQAGSIGLLLGAGLGGTPASFRQSAALGRLLAGIIKELPETSDEKKAPGIRRGRRDGA